MGGGGGGELSGGPQNTLEDAGGVADLPAGARSQGTLEGVHLDEEGDGEPGLAAGGVGEGAPAEGGDGGIHGAGSEGEATGCF